eukprot:9380135-Pyramimonas_sp.AAC.1
MTVTRLFHNPHPIIQIHREYRCGPTPRLPQHIADPCSEHLRCLEVVRPGGQHSRFGWEIGGDGENVDAVQLQAETESPTKKRAKWKKRVAHSAGFLQRGPQENRTTCGV